jgi:hypothetical protein
MQCRAPKPEPTRVPYSATPADGGYGASVSNWKPDIDVLTCPVLSKRLAKLSVQTSVYLSRRSAKATTTRHFALRWKTAKGSSQKSHTLMLAHEYLPLHRKWQLWSLPGPFGYTRPTSSCLDCYRPKPCPSRIYHHGRSERLPTSRSPAGSYVAEEV